MNIKKIFATSFFSFVYKDIDYLIFWFLFCKTWWKNRFPWIEDKAPIRFNGVKINKSYLPKIIKKIQVSFVGRLEIENDPYFFIMVALEY